MSLNSLLRALVLVLIYFGDASLKISSSLS